VADWLLFLGCKNVQVTQPSQDDGIDVIADEYVCQVKNYSTQLVSVNEVREIFGVSAMVGKRAMLFASTGLTASAAKFAEEAHIPAIQFVVETSELVPLNAEAEKFLDEGMY
jgi:HJR/Mrr/RecB family endonuclease